MTEIQEVAEAIKAKHGALWPLTWAVADFMAKQLAGDQGEAIIAQLTHELMQLNEPAPVPAQKPQTLYERLNSSQISLGDLTESDLDLSFEREAMLDAMRLLHNIHRVLDGKEWDSDTASDIASLLTAQGMVIAEPRDDCELTADELQQRYADADGGWGEHPRYARSVWKGYVSCNDTQRGYWDWVVSMLEQEPL